MGDERRSRPGVKIDTGTSDIQGVNLSRRALLRATVVGVPTAAALTTLSPAIAGRKRRSVTWDLISGLDQGNVFLVRGSRVGTLKRPVALFHHPFGSSAKAMKESPDAPGMRGVIEAFAEAGYLVVVSDFGGSLWGNDLNHRYITNCINIGVKNGGREGKALLIGASMGGGAVLSYAGMYPDRVAAVLGLIPAISLLDLSTFRDGILNASYDGKYVDSVHGPNHSPTVMATTPHTTVPDDTTTSRFSGMPVGIWYATRDATTLPVYTQEFIANIRSRRNPITKIVALDGEHTDAFVGTIPTANLINWAQKFLPV